MIDRRRVGFTTEPSTVVIDAWRVKLFCEAIGERDPIHWDTAAAQSAGHHGRPVPPTFLKAIEGEHFSSAALLKLLGVPLRGVLHAEQTFEHLAPAYVGDAVTVQRRVADVYDKKDGALSFHLGHYALAVRTAPSPTESTPRDIALGEASVTRTVGSP